MDTSTKYIDLCEKSEIQQEWVPSMGDYIYADNKVRILAADDGIDEMIDVWLPRIDQIQGLVFKEDINDVKIFTNFADWVEDQWSVNGKVAHSWEWLWLQYYNELHNNIDLK